ncbi:MAG: 5,10-methylenetetrahydrofolate reductase [bacterium]|nr:5,10-methylenetetrahydrofolate reductase [bacterium]
MRIDQLLSRHKPSFSFEFFPPKDEEGFAQLYRTLETLKPLAPTFVSVTFGAGGGTRAKTVDLVKRIKTEIGLEPMAHLTCVGMDRKQLSGILDELQSSGIDNVLALRGDPPKGQERFLTTEGGFSYANELAAFIRSRWSFAIGGACYPEVHPEAASEAADLDALKRKVDSGASFLISQLFFDNELFLRFRDKASRAGIRTPILAGIMPILNTRQIKRFAQMCGASIPVDLGRSIEAVEDDEEAVRHIGAFHATNQCLGLISEGVDGIHFYTLNRSSATRAIYQLLRTWRG